MHVPDVVTTSTALLLSLVLSFLPSLTSGSDRGWGMEVEGEGQDVGGARVRLLERGGHLLQEPGSSQLCDDARVQCTVRTGCQMALGNFFDGCRSILTGEESGCTTACQHALVSLLTTEDGAGLAFIHCNCSGHQVCEERKRRVQVCQQHVLHSMDLVRDHKATLSCSLARWICEADTSCLAALQYYVHHCSKLFTSTRCTARCRNSVHILYRQPNGDKLRTCRCEGDEDYDCPSLLNNTERLCLQPHRHGHSQSHHHRHHHHLHDYDEGDGFRPPGARAAQHRLFRRRQRRNKPGRKKPGKRTPKPSDSVPSKIKRGRRFLKRRAGPGRRRVKVKVRQRRRRCAGRKRGGRKKSSSSSSRRGTAGRKAKHCRPQRISPKLTSAWLRQLKDLTRFKERTT